MTNKKSYSSVSQIIFIVLFTTSSIGINYLGDLLAGLIAFPLYLDSVMTIAVAEAFMDAPDDEHVIRQRLIQSMQKWGHRYPGAGYGARFICWLALKDATPYNSFGNGSAMRVSSVGWYAKTLEELEAALIDSKKQDVSTLIDIKVLPKSMTDGYGAWWHVGIASTSSKEAVNTAFKNKDENLRKARKF